eukprot:TRINITY_DN10540_c0_g1_i1.p1 TRINITY_DN10540_c0_g1~~TRINITY_DN10540_c0_g1_i1.p1  ORF type:complete len:369 (-),score=37.52 TRINITY_DN10540_c0_g1_i1:28-1134(-)
MRDHHQKYVISTVIGKKTNKKIKPLSTKPNLPSTVNGRLLDKVAKSKPLKKVLVIGTNIIAATLVKELCCLKISTRFANPSDFTTDKLKNLPYETERFEPDDDKSYDAMFQDIELVVLALETSSDWLVNRSLYIFRCIKEKKIKHVVMANSCSLYALNENGSEINKWNNLCEKRLKNTGVPYTIFRLDGVFDIFVGPGIGGLIKTLRTLVGVVDTHWYLIDKRDVVDCIITVLLEMKDHKYKDYILTNGSSNGLRLEYYSEMISKSVGIKISCTSLSPESAVKTFITGGWSEEFSKAITEYYGETKIDNFINTNDIESILHRKPILFQLWAQENAHAFYQLCGLADDEETKKLYSDEDSQSNSSSTTT